jgi:hypothetical protein
MKLLYGKTEKSISLFEMIFHAYAVPLLPKRFTFVRFCGITVCRKKRENTEILFTHLVVSGEKRTIKLR